MIKNEIYQNIFDELSKYLIIGWNKLVIYLEYGETSYLFTFYEKIEDKYIKCFDIPDIDDVELYESFKAIDKILGSERVSLNNEWSNMTMVVDPEGNMNTYFDYTDLSSGNYKYLKDWKKKYLV